LYCLKAQRRIDPSQVGRTFKTVTSPVPSVTSQRGGLHCLVNTSILPSGFELQKQFYNLSFLVSFEAVECLWSDITSVFGRVLKPTRRCSVFKLNPGDIPINRLTTIICGWISNFILRRFFSNQLSLNKYAHYCARYNRLREIYL
jgi:hypothetical protein